MGCTGVLDMGNRGARVSGANRVNMGAKIGGADARDVRHKCTRDGRRGP